ncbi:hypothetical protein [Pseudochryseolinea flava]|uniref:DUF3575 domain-containing protein n=1 Tax=Pseudochryseolinea flava TaxID=2059302 RepID=A0A364Y635_9BACT|nr:hypothetical protein [Pseudochryseolinea flava]RAW01695.1 hypothetical protein DQQ10_08565 [Pseudochryseolinea flava]
MKYTIIIMGLLMTTLVAAQEQIEPTFSMPRATVKMAPMKFFERNFELGVELFDKSYKRSLNLDVGFKSGDEDFDEARGYNVELGFRRYAPFMKFHQKGDRSFYRGIYYSLSVRAQYFKGKEIDANDYYREQKTTSIAPAFTLGWQRTLWEALVLDIYVGGAVRFAENEYPYGEIDQHQDVSIFNPRYEGIMPKIGVKIGIGL